MKIFKKYVFWNSKEIEVVWTHFRDLSIFSGGFSSLKHLETFRNSVYDSQKVIDVSKSLFWLSKSFKNTLDFKEFYFS